MLHTTYVTELNSSRTVLVSTVTRMCEILAACAVARPDIALAEISYNSPVYSETYTQKLSGSALSVLCNIYFIIQFPFCLSFCVFYVCVCFLPARRYASAGYSDRNVSVRLSVCLSVRPSRAGIVSKRRKLAS